MCQISDSAHANLLNVAGGVDSSDGIHVFFSLVVVPFVLMEQKLMKRQKLITHLNFLKRWPDLKTL